jgi:endo-1,4-beta-xylanase
MGLLYTFLAVCAIISKGALALPAAGPAPEVPWFELRSGNSSLSNIARRAEAINFNQDYIASGANVQYSPNEGAGSFSVTYNTNQDFVVGLGWQPGDSK